MTDLLEPFKQAGKALAQAGDAIKQYAPTIIDPINQINQHIDTVKNTLSRSFNAPFTPTPAWQISINGQHLDPAINNRLISLNLSDERGFEADQLDLELDDSDGMLDLPPRGAKIQIALGWQGQALVEKGEYIVDEIEHRGSPDTLTIRARSADLRAGLAQKKERSWQQTTIGDIVNELAKANHLTPAIPDHLAKQRIGHLNQQRESDANLLHRLAREYDAVATVKNGRLIFTQAGDAHSVTGQAFPICLITRQAGDSHSFTLADRNAYTAVKAEWYDVEKGKRGDITVNKDTVFVRKRQVGKNGKLTKRTKLTAVQQKSIEPSADSVKILRHIYATEATALQGAKAAWQKIQRGGAQFSLTLAHGRPELFTELPAQVSGFKPAMDGTQWIISKLSHSISSQGYTCSLELERRQQDCDVSNQI